MCIRDRYQREIIRPNLNQSFEKMVYDVTTSWEMINHLDNSESAGPKSIKITKHYTKLIKIYLDTKQDKSFGSL